MTLPFISVIIPIYNAEQTLATCLNSLLSLKYPTYELVLINDGSTDSSGSIIETYASKHPCIRTFNKENGGASSARNIGMQMARGEWLTFCDADDTVNPDWLILSAIHCSPKVKLVVQPFITKESIIGVKAMNTIDFSSNKIDFLERYSNTPMFGSVWNKLFISTIINTYNLRFNEKFKLCEDEDFVYRYIQYLSTQDIIIQTCYGQYNYIAPDFIAKYKHVSNYYETRLSIAQTLKNIHQEHYIPNTYHTGLKSLTHALWDKLINNNEEFWNALKTYHQTVGKDILQIKTFPRLFKIILSLPIWVSFPILKTAGLCNKIFRHHL